MCMKISRTIHIFLISAVLIFGTTVSMGIPTSFGQYYEEPYDKDYDKKKSTGINAQKIKCINSNVNVNGIDVNQKYDPNSLEAQGLEGGEEENVAANAMNNNGQSQGINLEKNLANFCINVNANEQIAVAEEVKGTLSVTKTISCRPIDTQEPTQRACDVITTGEGIPEGQIFPDEFIIEVTGNNPDPSSFPGSTQPVAVTLDAGDYKVSETPEESVQNKIEGIEQGIGVTITGPRVTFSGDCNQQDSTGVGSIAEGDTQTCNIENVFESSSI